MYVIAAAVAALMRARMGDSAVGIGDGTKDDDEFTQRVAVVEAGMRAQGALGGQKPIPSLAMGILTSTPDWIDTSILHVGPLA